MKKKVTVHSLRKMKQQGEKITMLTAYDYPTAKLLDEAGVDCILVGDSLGMVVLGYENTTRVTTADILHHTKAVTRGVERAFVVADMPYLSYHISKEEAVRNAGILIQEGLADAVKMEGGSVMFETIQHVIDANIPVVGHLGLLPQSVLREGGYFIKGKEEKEIEKLKNDALKLQEMGVVALTLESVIADVAKEITEALEIPVIGIGAGKDTDGQVLVFHDVVGLFHGYIPQFVKQYAQLKDITTKAIENYVSDVKSGIFPDKEHSFYQKK
ncbi:3-methyl-2-oxobutanoate hydroxymethyltransferase [Balneicella halophila]|uniref:3-methyl-2-oxobutanoate hydroxymethyltransferase n=1 Tax=Balneicella halophila TaxID=1537566 RepID=A0A7L4US32_BALHA|nr:3-methyl-2-oxobutanoate hydroxymethyltransferase [Balneicella halophila]PVX52017.1 3-methyl-2-oxobutanoate hydroxymethyltransferase [Balneicella halophila]